MTSEPTTTAPTTPEPTATAPTVTAGTSSFPTTASVTTEPATTVAGVSTDVDGDGLADTGSPIGWLTLLAFGLLLAGSGLTSAVRRAHLRRH